MSSVEWFVDTGYWLAWLNSGDNLHQRARSLSTRLPSRLVTTEAVLFEVGNAMARPPLRAVAAAFLTRLRANPHLEIVPVDAALFDQAVARFVARPDEEWGLVDCLSFVVMEERGIREALSADHHFLQAGFRALLRD
jgi:predicted nucleic acid-binding protein